MMDGHLLRAEGMPAATVRGLLARASALLDGADAGAPLAGVAVALLFAENSTRTRSSFALAVARLGGTVIDLSSGTSLSKGETLADTARNVEAMGAGAIVVRAAQSGAAEVVARAVSCPVINAGDGRHEHPTQGLLDALAFARATGRSPGFEFAGVRLVIVGDVASSRVARSDTAVFTALGARVVLVGPAGLAPRSLECLGARVERDLDSALADADAVQMLRVQFERHGGRGVPSLRAYRDGYALTADRAGRMKPGAVVMHPGPMNRGIEIDDAVADGLAGPRSIVLDQVACGVGVRMVVLERLIAGRAGVAS